MIVENDVRLLRRYLITRMYGKAQAGYTLGQYFGGRPFQVVLPTEQTVGMREKYLRKFPANEQWLANAWGCIILPDYNDVIFLNSKWENPRTMYVHLLEVVPELGELGEIYWYPEPDEEKWRRRCDRNHAEYTQYRASLRSNAKKSWIDRILGR